MSTRTFLAGANARSGEAFRWRKFRLIQIDKFSSGIINRSSIGFVCSCCIAYIPPEKEVKTKDHLMKAFEAPSAYKGRCTRYVIMWNNYFLGEVSGGCGTDHNESFPLRGSDLSINHFTVKYLHNWIIHPYGGFRGYPICEACETTSFFNIDSCIVVIDTMG